VKKKPDRPGKADSTPQFLGTSTRRIVKVAKNAKKCLRNSPPVAVREATQRGRKNRGENIKWADCGNLNRSVGKKNTAGTGEKKKKKLEGGENARHLGQIPRGSDQLAEKGERTKKLKMGKTNPAKRTRGAFPAPVGPPTIFDLEIQGTKRGVNTAAVGGVGLFEGAGLCLGLEKRKMSAGGGLPSPVPDCLWPGTETTPEKSERKFGPRQRPHSY